ncbi:MAG TPA: UDP-3-O-(3-hydroxymyristoyl)glucosamine N-acyltransferase [Gammaproteobacteria bacterium]
MATLRELAAEFGCELRGDGERVVVAVGTLTGAGPNQITFLANPAYRAELAKTRAGAVILEPRYGDECPVPALVTGNPYATYARIAARLHPPPAAEPGVHPAAVVAPDAVVPPSAHVGPGAVVGARTRLGERAVIGPGSVVGEGVEIGPDTRLAARVTVYDRVRIGARCLLHAGAVIGADGFGFALDGGEWVKIPQVGSVVIGDDVEIGANSCIDRGAIDDTRIGNGVKLDNLVQIGHNVQVGDHTVMASMAGVAGSTRIGKRCMIAGGGAMINHLEICDDVVLTFRATVLRSIDRPGTYSGTLPAEESRAWRRNAARFGQLDALAGRLRAAERKLEALWRRTEKKEDGDD